MIQHFALLALFLIFSKSDSLILELQQTKNILIPNRVNKLINAKFKAENEEELQRVYQLSIRCSNSFENYIIIEGFK